MTFTKKHNPGCGCCECEGTPISLYYRIPEGETEYFRTRKNRYTASAFVDFESYNSTWDEVAGSWDKRYYQTLANQRDYTPRRAHGLMTEDDDALLVYKQLDQNQQRSVVTVFLPWINDEFPDYSEQAVKSDAEIKVVCAYQDTNNYLFAKIRFKRRTALPSFTGSYSEDLKRGADKVSEIEFYERSAGTDTKIGETRYFYSFEGPWGSNGRNYGNRTRMEGNSPIVIEWCYVPEAYQTDGKMTVTIYSNEYNGLDREYNNSKGSLFDFKDEYPGLHWWGGALPSNRQGHHIFTEEMNASGTMVGFGTGTIVAKPSDDELSKRDDSIYTSFNKGVVFEKFGNYLHNKENGACPKCAQGCVPHATGFWQVSTSVDAHLRRQVDAEFIYTGQYEKLPSTNDDLNFVNDRPLDDTNEEYAEIRANNSETKWITYSEVAKAVDHTFKLVFHTKGVDESTHEISLVFDYLDENNYHRLHFSGVMSDPAEGDEDHFDYQTAATVQLYKMSGGSESTVGDSATATLNHQGIEIGVCTMTGEVQIWLGEWVANLHGWGDTNGVLEHEMRNTTLHGGVRQGFMTHTTSDDDVIQAPNMAVYERRPTCYPCAKTRCDGCGNIPSFYKLEIAWGYWGWSGNWWDGTSRRTWITKPHPSEGPFHAECRELDGTYIVPKTADCVFELANDKFKFWFKLVRSRWGNTLEGDMQMWINDDEQYISFIQEPSISGDHIGSWGLAYDCGLPHNFTVYSNPNPFLFGNLDPVKCHFYSWAFFTDMHYRVRIIRE